MQNLNNDKDLQSQIQSALEAGGIESDVDALPMLTADFEQLHGKTIILVDDDEDFIAEFFPLLMVATGGSASFILHRAQSIQELSKAISEAAPDWVLIDGELSGGLQGYEVVRDLQKFREPLAPPCIGFSSAQSLEEPFLAAGAQGFIEKNRSNLQVSLQRISSVVAV